MMRAQSTRSKTTSTVLAVTVIGGCLIGGATGMISGCGPTKAGLDARAEARTRLDVVNAQVSYDQAKRAFEVGQLDRARREIEAAINRFPDSVEYHLLHGRIHLEAHRLERSLAAFERAIEADPERAEPHYFAGIVFQRWSNNDRAHKHYYKASELDESNAQYLLAAAEAKVAMGEFDAAQDLIEPRLAYFEHNAALRHLLGQIALLQDEPRKAARLLSEARLLNGNDEMLLEELAWAQYAAGQYAQCYESIQQLHRMSTVRRADLLHAEARCLMHMERPNEARNIYLELTRIAPADPEVWIELGALAWDIGDMRRVAMAGTRVVALAPERHEGYALRAIHARDQGNANDAARFLREAIRRAPEAAMPHLLLGQVLEEKGEHEQALLAYGRALNITPNDRYAQALFNRLSQSEHMANVPLDR